VSLPGAIRYPTGLPSSLPNEALVSQYGSLPQTLTARLCMAVRDKCAGLDEDKISNNGVRIRQKQMKFCSATQCHFDVLAVRKLSRT
jgi:hypothetical protein